MRMNYGERLRHARKAKGYTQEQLAKHSGVKQGTISKIERGDQEASTFDIDLAAALDVRPKWLRDGGGDMQDTPHHNEGKDSTGSHYELGSGLDFDSVDFALQSLAMVKDYPAYKEKSKDTDWLARAFIALYKANSDDILREAGPAVILKLVA